MDIVKELLREGLVLPELGEIRKSKEIGYKAESHNFIWQACQVCGKRRWVPLLKGKPLYIKCNDCSHPKAEASSHR